MSLCPNCAVSGEKRLGLGRRDTAPSRARSGPSDAYGARCVKRAGCLASRTSCGVAWACSSPIVHLEEACISTQFILCMLTVPPFLKSVACSVYPEHVSSRTSVTNKQYVVMNDGEGPRGKNLSPAAYRSNLPRHSSPASVASLIVQGLPAVPNYRAWW